jgi:hypothetical protein
MQTADLVQDVSFCIGETNISAMNAVGEIIFCKKKLQLSKCKKKAALLRTTVQMDKNELKVP